MNRPVIGSGLHREHGTRFQRFEDPFPNTPWAGDRRAWPVVRDTLYVIGIVLFIWAFSCFALSLEAVK